jgi:dihydroxyacetone kinase-like protein
MKKVINDPEQYVAEALEGLICAHPGIYAQSGKTGRVIILQTPKSVGKVGVASGGGFGHLPLFAGHVH